MSGSSPDVSVKRLSLHTTQQNGVALVQCTGELVSGVTDLLYKEVKGLIPESKLIVLDLSALTRMDSMGIGTLVRLYVSAKASGCKIDLRNPAKRIRDLLGLTNLLSVFEVCGENDIRLM